MAIQPLKPPAGAGDETPPVRFLATTQDAAKKAPKIPALQHVREWLDEAKAAMPARNHRDPVEFLEEQWPLLVARLVHGD